MATESQDEQLIHSTASEGMTCHFCAKNEVSTSTTQHTTSASIGSDLLPLLSLCHKCSKYTTMKSLVIVVALVLAAYEASAFSLSMKTEGVSTRRAFFSTASGAAVAAVAVGASNSALQMLLLRSTTHQQVSNTLFSRNQKIGRRRWHLSKVIS